MADIVRVLRVIEYIGPREWVEATLKRSIQGTLWLSEPSESHPDWPLQVIRTATVGNLMERMDKEEVHTLEEHIALGRTKGFGGKI